jgi:5-methylcytosine-specific restriction endonuclease McrA
MPDDTTILDHLEPAVARRLANGLLKKIGPLVEQGQLPKHAHPVEQAALDVLTKSAARGAQTADRCPRWLWLIRRAVILNRDRYTCRYCRRTAWEVYTETKRTLRFELDHRKARSRLTDRAAFDVKNTVTACRSCNVIKGQMEIEPFLAELESLAKGVLRRLSATEHEATV